MIRVGVLGASGLLGCWLVPYLRQKPEFQVVTFGRSPDADCRVDFDSNELPESLLRLEIDVVINLAALADVDRCQREADEAYRANVKVCEEIAVFLDRRPEAFCVQVSTDHFYDGPGAKREEETVFLNTYAVTKYAGELALANRRSVILRTNFFGRANGGRKPSFSDTIVNSFRTGQKMQLFTDAYFSPLHWSTLVEIMGQILLAPKFGVFNLGSTTFLSKADFSLSLIEKIGLPASNYVLTEAKAIAIEGRAKRPLNMAMSSDKFEEIYKIKLPTLEHEIGIAAKEYL